MRLDREGVEAGCVICILHMRLGGRLVNHVYRLP